VFIETEKRAMRVVIPLLQLESYRDESRRFLPSSSTSAQSTSMSSQVYQGAPSVSFDSETLIVLQ
jgi:hypothetical protein